jgi:hypothetical protein
MTDREDITLTGDDARWFNAARQRVAEQRDGHAPGNAELVRLLLQDADL